MINYLALCWFARSQRYGREMLSSRLLCVDEAKRRKR